MLGNNPTQPQQATSTLKQLSAQTHSGIRPSTKGDAGWLRGPVLSLDTAEPSPAGMALVDFTLSEDGVSAFNDALVCIHKFSDDVSLEIKKDKVSTFVRHPRGNFSCTRILLS